MILRIGVEDGEQSTARQAVAEAAKGCVEMFQTLRAEWRSVIGFVPIQKTIRRKNQKTVQNNIG
jgi:hypothetical protein